MEQRIPKTGRPWIGALDQVDDRAGVEEDQAHRSSQASRSAEISASMLSRLRRGRPVAGVPNRTSHTPGRLPALEGRLVFKREYSASVSTTYASRSSLIT